MVTKEKEVEDKNLCSFIIDTCIHDIDLPIKVKDKIQALNLSLETDKIYTVSVYFDKRDYQNADFYTFLVERKQWRVEKLAKLGAREKQEAIIHDVLSAQLDNIYKEIRKFNISYRNIKIVGSEFDKANQVKVEITEDNRARQEEISTTKSKKSKSSGTIYTVASIVPDYSALIERASKVLLELMEREVEKEKIKDYEKSKHTPNLIDTSKVFLALANALITEFPDKYTSSELVVNELISQATLKNDWPLEICSKDVTSGSQKELESEIDCPEYLIYIKKRHGWTFKKIPDLDVAKQIILTEGYNRKFVDEIIVLQNLNPIYFNLFVEDRGEINPISKEEAHTAKKLLLSWKK